MKALTYLLITKIKNRILMLKRKPAFLILYGFVILMIVFAALSALLIGNGGQELHFSDERIIYLCMAGFGLLFLYIYTTTGLSTGSTLFSMSDVGLLFVAPISTKKILFYGLINTMGKALLASIFIFYQVGNLKINFGYGMKEILALFIIYAIMVIFGQLLSIAVYIYSNGNSTRKNAVRYILYTAIGLLLVSVLLLQNREQVGILEAFMRLVDSSWFGYVPMAGWAVMFFKGVTDGLILSVILSLAFYLLLSILIISLLTVGKADYYEDVLLSTEINDQKLKAAKDGRKSIQGVKRRVKVRDDDQAILKGKGAMTIFYKHVLEMKRGSRFIFIDGYTIIICAGAGIAGYNFRDTGAAYAVMAVLIYLQYFLTMFGRLKQELVKPYIYMIPEKSIKKVITASLTSILKPCVDAVCVFAVVAAVGGADPVTCIFYALAYSAAGLLFVALTILYQRILGGQPNRMIQMMIGLGLLIITLSPGIIFSVVFAFVLPEVLSFLCLLPFILWCLFIAWIIFFTCGNLIDKAEYTGRL